MFRIVVLQVAAMLVVALLAWLIGGVHAALSAALGALASTLPNALFAWRLALDAKRPQGAGAHVFFIGELVKLLLTVALLFAIARFYDQLNWLALLAGFVVALKSYLVAFLIDRHK